MSVSAYDVAALLIAEQQAAGRTVDKMQLQKLLYLVQGTHLELWGEPAFREPIRAYEHGPVVESVEQTYRAAAEGSAPLPGPIGGHPDGVPVEVAESVRLVLAHFGTWTGPNLERFVKRTGTPWRDAHAIVTTESRMLGSRFPASGDRTRNVITTESMAGWFRRHGMLPTPPPLTDHDRELFDRAAAGDEDALTELLR